MFLIDRAFLQMDALLPIYRISAPLYRILRGLSASFRECGVEVVLKKDIDSRIPHVPEIFQE